MILDLIAIVFIIIISFCFSSNNITKDCCFSNIIVGLSVIVFYKIVRYFKLKPILDSTFKMSKEPFENDVATMAESLNNFLSNPNNIPTPPDISRMSNEQLKTYTESLKNLTDSINLLRTGIGSSSGTSISQSSNIGNLDISALQQAQNFELDYLTNQVTNAQNVLNAKAAADEAASYKPIKVFSSCVMSNADGSTTFEKPVSNKVKSSSGIQAFEDINSNIANIISNTISQKNNQTSSPSPLNINLTDFLAKLKTQ
jgi:hypothetical protein